MNNNLKSCPFCGGEAVLNHGHMITATGQYLANVKCSECGIASRVVWSTDSPEEAVKEAIEAWNRRVATDKNVGDKERTAKVIDKSVGRHSISDFDWIGKCEKCGNEIQYSFDFCPYCGAELEWSE